MWVCVCVCARARITSYYRFISTVPSINCPNKSLKIFVNFCIQFVYDVIETLMGINWIYNLYWNINVVTKPFIKWIVKSIISVQHSNTNLWQKCRKLMPVLNRLKTCLPEEQSKFIVHEMCRFLYKLKNYKLVKLFKNI